MPAGPAFDERFEILGELGRGGMGIVYRVHDRRRNQIVALKTLQWIDPAALYRFKQEFRVLADVVHPNLVTLYELFSDGLNWCFTMEYLDGQNFLAHVLSASGEQSTDEHPSPRNAVAPAPKPAVPIDRLQETLPCNRIARAPLTAAQIERLRHTLKQLSEAVSFLHASGKLHRDIKPQNILVTPRNRVVLLDFGLSTELERSGLHQSTISQVVGTCAYMSPEQAAARPVSPASDWYSVGAMLYQALTGRLPFEGTIDAVLQDKQVREPAPPRELSLGIPDDLNDLCVALLRRAPEDRPPGEEILSRLSRGQPSQGGTRTWTALPRRQSQLIGRENHLWALADGFQAMTQGQTVAVYVQGRSGAGKSALVQSFLDDVALQGPSIILRGKCNEQESMPYKALDSLVDLLSRYLGRLSDLEAEALLPRDMTPLTMLFPVLRRVEAVAKTQRALSTSDPFELRRRAVAGLRELLARIGDRQPLVLMIDDLQWGDADSAAVLADLLRPPDSPVLLLVACFRSEDLSQGPFQRALEQFHMQAGAALDLRTIDVEPLSEQESLELATALLAEADAGLAIHAQAVARESAGNPFFLHELARHVATSGQSTSGQSSARGNATAAFALDDILFQRAQALPEDARQVLEVVAVAGRPLLQNEAFQAAELTSDQAGVLAFFRAERLLRSTGSGEGTLLETYHDRVREAITARLSQHRLEQHHQRLADTLECSPSADPEEVAVHFQAAGDGKKAAHFYRKAAQAATDSLAFDRAAKLFRKALDLAESSTDARDLLALRVELAEALANAGRGFDAAREYTLASHSAPPLESRELQHRAALQYLISGHFDEGFSAYRTAVQAIGLAFPKTPLRALMGVLWQRGLLRLRGLRFTEKDESDISRDELTRIDMCWSAFQGLSMYYPTYAAYFQVRGLLSALRTGERYRIARALTGEAGHLSCAGRSTQKRVALLLSRAGDLAASLASPPLDSLHLLMRGFATYFLGDWKNAIPHFDSAAIVAREQCQGMTWEIDTANTFAMWCLIYLGEWSELSRRYQVLARDAVARGDLYAETNFSTYIRAVVLLRDDKPHEVLHGMKQSIERWSSHGFHVQHHCVILGQSIASLYMGDGEVAWRRLFDHRRVYTTSLLMQIAQVRIDIYGLRARAAVMAAQTEIASAKFARAALADVRRLENERVPVAVAMATLVRAGLENIRGDTESAVGCLRESVAQFENANMLLSAAAARRRLGELIGGESGREQIAVANAWIAGQGIKNPTRITALLAPGFADG